MDFSVLFEKIGLWEQGRTAFWKLNDLQVDENAAWEAFSKSDEAFGQWLKENKGETSARELTMYLYLRWSEAVLKDFRAKDMDESVFYDSMISMSQACRYCYEATGVYGIEQKLYRPWFRIFLQEKRIFRFGRLEFELTQSKHTVQLQGKTIEAGQPCLYVHIPRYEPLQEQACRESYCRAREFFKKYFAMETPFFFCRSWLMHPWLKEDLPETSGIRRFADAFTVLDVKQDHWGSGFWIFERYCKDPGDYPEDTTLRKKAKRRMVQGLPIGVATGVRL